MVDIPAKLVKELRDRTSAGMMDCKAALQECKGEIEAAIDWLRQKGLSKAAKRAGRATSEGIVAHKISPDFKIAAMVEVMCETDFVARSEGFQAFAKDMIECVCANAPADAAALAALVGDAVNDQIAKTGENTSVGRFAIVQVSGPGTIGCYIHSNGKIGVLVELSCGKEASSANPAVQELAKNIAMQIAAANAQSVDSSSLDPALVERERQVFRQKTLDEGKPESIVDKIVDGRIKKFYQEVCLLEQAYIRDDKVTIAELVKAEGKAVGDELKVVRFFRFQLGEGAN